MDVNSLEELQCKGPPLAHHVRYEGNLEGVLIGAGSTHHSGYVGEASWGDRKQTVPYLLYIVYRGAHCKGRSLYESDEAFLLR